MRLPVSFILHNILKIQKGFNVNSFPPPHPIPLPPRGEGSIKKG